MQTSLINSAIKHSHPDYISKVLHVLHLGSDYGKLWDPNGIKSETGSVIKFRVIKAM